MSSNLRAKPIEGNVTDSAGNVLRDAVIVIKEVTPRGSNTIDSTKSDDEGYFITKPIQTGIYDVYESGILVARQIHAPNQHIVQAYAAADTNTPDNLMPFHQASYDSQYDINKYRYYLQIEPESTDIKTYGHTYPIYDPNIIEDDLVDVVAFHELGEGVDAITRLTNTRFDIEYFAPLTEVATEYRKVRWVGVPAIRFNEDARLVVPLDYYSVHLREPISKYTLSGSNVTARTGSYGSDEVVEIFDDLESEEFVNLTEQLNKGDILKVSFSEAGVTFYGIYVDFYYEGSPSSYKVLRFKKWKSSNFISSVLTNDSTYAVTEASRYNAMFSGLANITVSANEKFSVTENTVAQNGIGELYNYSDR